MNHEQLLKNLVEIKSFSGEEAQIRNFIQDWFKERGIDAFLQDENLTVHFEGKDRTRAFIFNSHMDTVGSGDIPWKSDPWKPTTEGDRLIGLGASDMKSGMAASMLLAEQVSKTGKPPVDIWFSYVVKEEIDGSGSENFIKWFANERYTRKYKDMAAIFTEPTNLKLIEHGHRGNYFLEVTAKGDSVHASRPDLLKGPSAVRKIVRFSDVFQKEVEKWRKEFADKYFKPSITVGEMTSIRANLKVADGKIVTDSANKFADRCVATFDLRTTPKAHEVIFPRVKNLGRKFGVTVRNLYPPAPAGFTKPTERIVKVANSVVKNSKVVVTLGSADLGFLAAKGIKGIIFGPGVKHQEHKTNEYALPAQIPQAVEIYKQIVEAWAK